MQLIDSAEYTEALRRLDALAMQLSPEDRLVALYWKVRCLQSLNELGQARMYAEEALTHVDPSNPLRICLELESATLLRVEEGAEKSAHELRSLLNRYAEELKTPDFFWIYVQAKTDLGNCLSGARRYLEASKELEEALSLQDQPLSRYYIHLWLGEAYLQLGDPMKARDHFERARGEQTSAPKAGISPYYEVRIGYDLALIAYKQHRFDDAARELDVASAVEIQDADLSGVVNRLRDLVGQARQSIRVQ
jgi:tetratricopeptide (TPR) repeat protein